MPIDDILKVLKEHGGYYVLSDSEGEEFAIMRMADLEDESEKQLELAPREVEEMEPTAEDLLERINRDIAMYQSQEQEQEHASDTEADVPDIPRPPVPPRTVRFEPLRGDIDPDLQ